MMRYLTRPKDILSKEEKKEVVKDFYKKAEQPKSKILDWINYNNKAFGNNKEPITADETKVAKAVEERFNDRIQDPKFFQNKLKNIQKKEPVKIVKKPKPKPTYLNGNVIDITPLIDDEWWNIFEEKPPEDKVLLKVPRRKLKGLASLLNVG